MARADFPRGEGRLEAHAQANSADDLGRALGRAWRRRWGITLAAFLLAGLLGSCTDGNSAGTTDASAALLDTSRAADVAPDSAPFDEASQDQLADVVPINTADNSAADAPAIDPLDAARQAGDAATTGELDTELSQDLAPELPLFADAPVDTSADDGPNGVAAADSGGLAEAGAAADAVAASDAATDADAASQAVADAPPAAAADGVGDSAGDAKADAPALKPPLDQPAANLMVSLTSDMPSLNGNLVVMAAEIGVASPQPGGPGGPMAWGTPLWSGPAPALPAAVWVELPAGKWMLAAMVIKPDAKFPTAGGMACGDGALLALQGSATPQAAVINLVDAENLGNISALCGTPDPAVGPALLKAQSEIQTPPTAAGGAHFMNALVFDDRLWVAGSQDGYVSFDFPGGLPVKSGFAGWKVHGGPVCNRIVRVQNSLFCSSRSGYLQIMELNALQAKTQLHQKWLGGEGTVTEGMALQQGALYVAMHKNGVAAVQPDAPYGKIAVVSPPQLTQAWDAAAVGSEFLVVANGGLGLAVLDVGGIKKQAPVVVGQLALPGVAAYLATQGSLVAVGAMGGGLHLVDIGTTGQPKLRATLHSPINVYGVTLAGQQVFAAAGHAILAADVPPLDAVGPWRARGSLFAHHFALDVDTHGDGLLTAEFQSVRRLTVNLQAAAQGPAMIVGSHLPSAVAPVGGKLSLTVPIHNAGAAVLTVSSMEWAETAGVTLIPFQAKGPWKIAPGTTLPITIEPPKQLKGILQHQLIVHSDDPNQAQHYIMHVESTWLQAGDTLPVMPAYQDAGGSVYNIPAYFKGKVSVLLIGAQSCPVAFQALASASRDLAPLVKQGKIAVLAVNPWDTPSTPEAAALDLPFPLVYSGLTTKDNHDWSEVLDVELGQPVLSGPPMPIVYVVGKDGKLALAKWGYHTQEIMNVVQEQLAKP